MKFSIGIVTYNVFFYNRLSLKMIDKHTPNDDYEILIYDNGSTDGSVEWLSKQENVKLFRSNSINELKHGDALDFLVKQSSCDYFCALDADAFPVSDDWTLPLRALESGEAVIAGIDRTWGYKLSNYVHPSYFCGNTNFIKDHSFCDNFPNWDTGELITEAANEMRLGVKYWTPKMVSFGGKFSPKPCDYAGLVWHTWWSSRKMLMPKINQEFEENYHAYCEELFREKYGSI